MGNIRFDTVLIGEKNGALPVDWRVHDWLRQGYVLVSLFLALFPLHQWPAEFFVSRVDR